MPDGISHLTEMAPLAPSSTTALLARVCPAEKEIVRVPRSGAPTPKILRSPPVFAAVTVMLTESALAPAGIPHFPVSVNGRVKPASSAGPPSGPFWLRVSTTRHGVSVKKESAGFAETVIMWDTGVELPLPLEAVRVAL